MAKAAEPAVITDEIVFELERFERSGGQLMLSGRWFGVRGRRFVRPTLTLALDGERIRALADLDDKPWAAEDGESWRASFPWSKSGRVEDSELSVAPDITIQLPAPGARRGRPQRLAAQPRREAMSASFGPFAAPAETPAFDPEFEASEPEIAASEPEIAVADTALPEPEPAALLAELDGLRVQLTEAETASALAGAELESLRGEVASLRAELAEARQALTGRGDQAEALRAELSATRSAREAALRSAAQAEAEREEALTRAAQAESERDGLATEKAELTAALEESRATIGQLTRQHEEVVASRGAALVMRGATQALPAYEHHVGWVRRGLAVLVLIGIVFAVLIVLGAL
jgi:hypothetical protein